MVVSYRFLIERQRAELSLRRPHASHPKRVGRFVVTP
jgi:hypothetical protein